MPCAVVVSRYTEPSVGGAQSSDAGDTLLIRNALGVEVVIQSLQHAGWGASDGEGGGGGGGWGGDASDAEWGINGSEYAHVAPEGFADFFSGDVVSGAAAIPAAAAEHSFCRRDVSRPTAVAPGQSVECRLPARTDWRDSSVAAADFLVRVPGYHTVAGIRIGGRGARAYPLVAEAATGRDSGVSRKAQGVAERLMRAPGRGAALNKMGLALVVDVGEKTSTAAGGGGGGSSVGAQADGADERLSMASSSLSSSRGGLVAELRTNVCVHNASASDVEVDMAEAASAAAAIATNPGATRPAQPRRQDRKAAAAAAAGAAVAAAAPSAAAGDGSRSSAVVRLAAGARLALPLPVLSCWQLRVAGDATEAWSHPLRLSPALLDPAVPNALRLTSDMERNSLCLRMTTSSGRASSGGVADGGGSGASGATANAAAAAAAAAQGETYTAEPGAGGRRQVLAASPEFPADDEPRRKTPQHVGFSLQHSPRSSSRTPVSSQVDDYGADRPRPTASPSPPSPLTPGGTVSGGASSSGTADWVLMIQPSYIVTNALPCAMEVEVLQPPLTAGSGASRSERHRSWAGADSGAIDPEETCDLGGSWREDTDPNSSSDDSDAVSVASSVTSRQTQQSEGKARAVVTAADRAEARVVKAAVRNPALDLFFLPTSSSSSSCAVGASGGGGGGGGLGRARSGSRTDSGGGSSGAGNRTRSWSGVDTGGGNGPDSARGGCGSETAGSKRRGWPLQGSQQQQEEDESEEYDPIRGLESVWKGLIGSGQEAKVRNSAALDVHRYPAGSERQPLKYIVVRHLCVFSEAVGSGSSRYQLVGEKAHMNFQNIASRN